MMSSDSCKVVPVMSLSILQCFTDGAQLDSIQLLYSIHIYIHRMAPEREPLPAYVHRALTHTTPTEIWLELDLFPSSSLWMISQNIRRTLIFPHQSVQDHETSAGVFQCDTSKKDGFFQCDMSKRDGFSHWKGLLLSCQIDFKWSSWLISE